MLLTLKTGKFKLSRKSLITWRRWIFLLILNIYVLVTGIFSLKLPWIHLVKKAKLKRKATFQLQNIMCSYELIAIGAPKTQLWDNLLGDVKTPLQISRIDYFQISDDLQYVVKSCEFLCPLSSEHLPIKITLHLQSFKTRGRGCWKFNRSLLENRKFICDFKCKINAIVCNLNEFDDVRVNWEHLKFKMREFSRNESIKTEKDKQRKLRRKG